MHKAVVDGFLCAFPDMTKGDEASASLHAASVPKDPRSYSINDTTCVASLETDGQTS